MLLNCPKACGLCPPPDQRERFWLDMQAPAKHMEYQARPGWERQAQRRQTQTPKVFWVRGTRMSRAALSVASQAAITGHLQRRTAGECVVDAQGPWVYEVCPGARCGHSVMGFDSLSVRHHS